MAETSNHHVLLPPDDAARKRRATTPAWPTYRGASHLVGTSASHVTVYYDAALGANALQNAHDLLAAADAIVTQNNAFFGVTGGAVDVILFALNGATDGTGGADHDGCDFTTGKEIEVDVAYGAPERIAALFEAELSECAMNGTLCGLSTGEALSRWCAAVVSNNALGDFATAPTWAQDGMPNWVDQTDPTDQGADSTGCGMAFLSWLMSQGYSLTQIAQAMVGLGDAGTLAQLYATLTGDAASNAWQTFLDAINALAGGVTSDDPFNALAAIPAGAAT
jgi:hypothetical protein